MARLHAFQKHGRTLSRIPWAERLTLHATILLIAVAVALIAVAP
jgi:hypothetical protein